jgi:diaminopimelate decarboxylase
MIDRKLLSEEVELTIRKYVMSEEFMKNPVFYLYDLKSISERLDFLQTVLPKNVQLYYALKANPHDAILYRMKSHDACSGIEVASIGELEKALRFFSPNNICFNGPGKTDYELSTAISNDIRLISIESIVEAQKIDRIAKKLNKNKVDILVRVNSNYCIEGEITSMVGVPTKFGIDENEVLSSLSFIKKNCTHISINGYHVYGATGVLDYRALINYTQYVFALVNNLDSKADFPSKIIDFGGGFGIDYANTGKFFDVTAYSEELNLQIENSRMTNSQFLLELGRYLVADSGFYCTEILDIKKNKGKKYIITSGGVNHLSRPSISDENQPIQIIQNETTTRDYIAPEVMNEFVDVGGPLCFPEDLLAKNVFIPSARVGDILVVTKAGAYGYTGSQVNLLSHRYPPEIFINK